MIRRLLPLDLSPLLLIAASLLVLGIVFFVRGPEGDAISKEASLTPEATSVVTGSGGSVSRERMAPRNVGPDACEDCSEVEVEPSPTLTATPAPTETPTPPPTPRPVPYKPDFSVDARAVAILEAPCGALVYGASEHERLPPASLTKIVTALAAIDRVDLGDRVEVHLSAKELKRRTRSSVMGLEPGMTVTVKDLLYGLFLPSGNDAAIVLAEHVSGSEQAFAELMNETAAKLRLNDSTFSNAHGLDSDGLRSSAYDMALAGMAMMRNHTLAAISGARVYMLEGGLTLNNGNRLLDSYPGAYGVKIGYTNDADYTIVAAASRDGRDLFLAVLGSEDLFAESARLLDWAFQQTPTACGS